MAGGNYTLLITDETSGNAEGYESGMSSPPSKTDSDSAVPKDVFGTVAKVWGATSMARQVFSWTTAMATRGNSDLKQKIDATQQLVEQAVGIGIAFAINPVAGALSFVSTAFGYIKEIEQSRYERQMEGYSIGVLRERAGPSLNRSRSGAN